MYLPMVKGQQILTIERERILAIIFRLDHNLEQIIKLPSPLTHDRGLGWVVVSIVRPAVPMTCLCTSRVAPSSKTLVCGHGFDG